MNKLQVVLLFLLLMANCVDAGAADEPFGESDPFALIKGTEQETQPEIAILKQDMRKPQSRAEVFLKGFGADINNDSRINPGNRYQQIKTTSALAEMRLTVNDTLNNQENLRWLFKGYASQSSYREANNTLRSQVRIDELFADWKGEHQFASIGKRRINWGHAQGFSPLNVVASPRDPLNPSYQTEGKPILWLNASGMAGSLDLILTRNYDSDWNSDSNRWGLRWNGASTGADYALYYFDGSAYADGRAFERMAGASFALDVTPGMTLYMEAASFLKNYRNYYSSGLFVQQKDGGYAQGVAGLLFDLGGKNSFFIEYFHNSQGYSAEERRNYLKTADAILAMGFDPALAADFMPLGMNHDYLLANYKKEMREKFNLDLSVLLARDGSASTRAELSYALSSYYELHGTCLANAGSRDSEFGNAPYRSLFEIGIKASF